MRLSFISFIKLVSFLTVTVLLSACATHAPKEAEWPTDMPTRSYFVDYFASDIENQKSSQDLDEYLMWVVRFYKGWELYHNGWLRVTDSAVLGAKNPQMAAEVKTKMDAVGKVVSAEWAKNKNSNRILTRHVAVWGNALLEAIRRDQEVALIDRVLADATALVNNQIDLASVKPERYFPQDKDDAFAP